MFCDRILFKLSLALFLILPSVYSEASSAGADKLYKQGKYNEAAQEYKKALDKNKDSSEINFCLGTAQYKLKDYHPAEESFRKALATEDKKGEARANYNLGNTKYRQGKLKEGKDLEGALNLLKESLGYYKRAIELVRFDEDARFNYEFTQKEIELMEKKLAEQKKEQKQEKSSQNKEEKKQEQPQNSNPENKQEKNSQQGKEKEEGSQGQDERNDQQDNQEKKQNNGSQPKEADKDKQKGLGQGQEEKEMSEEEARVLLEGNKQDELSGIIKDDKKWYYPKAAKDW